MRTAEVMSLLPPDEQLQSHINQQLYRAPMLFQKDVTHIKDWLLRQPHLPNIEDERFIRGVVFGCKFSLEKTKRVLDMHYTVRGTVPEFFDNRDPCSVEVTLSCNTIYYFPLPQHTPEGYRVSITAVADTDVSKFSPKEYMKRVFMISDIRLLEECCLGDVLVYDLKGFGVQHLLQIDMKLARKFAFCGQEAVPARIKMVHFINVPHFINKILAIFRPFMKAKIWNRIIIHSDDICSLYKYIPQDILPEEYGGNAGEMKELNGAWLQKMQGYRDWFLQSQRRTSDESMRLERPLTELDLFGVDGSFKELSID